MSAALADLRRRLRAERRDLSVSDQNAAEKAVTARLETWLHRLRPATAAAYVATDGEVSVARTVILLRSLGWRIAYPRIVTDEMLFHVVGDEASLVQGRWGLLEPLSSDRVIAADQLDLVLTPLVAFDRNCNRVGRGRAFYDRAFAFLMAEQRPARPVLVGLAHDLQQVELLQTASHDVQLDAVITPGFVHGVLP